MMSNHNEIFQRLFHSNASKVGAMADLKFSKSVLDAYVSDIKEFKKLLPSKESDKIDEYHASIRKMEENLKREMQWSKTPKPNASFKAPGQGTLKGSAGARMVMDMITGAFAADQTRVVTYKMPQADLLDEWVGEGRVGAHKMSHSQQIFESTEGASVGLQL